MRRGIVGNGERRVSRIVAARRAWFEPERNAAQCRIDPPTRCQ